jgi:diguanylate cyclase (GGDEF)-like protein
LPQDNPKLKLDAACLAPPMNTLPSKWTPAGIIARTRAILQQPRDILVALQMGVFLWRTSLGAARGNPLRHFSRLRRKARSAQPFGRHESDRIVRISYVYDPYFKARRSRYVRALLLHHFADSKVLNGDMFPALGQMIENVHHGGHGAAVLFDVDRFGSIGDSLGNAEADRVLATIEQVIERVLAERGIAGRFGGDEFLLVIEASEDEVVQLVQQVRLAVSAAALENGYGKNVTVSAGVTIATQTSNVIDVMEHAAQALRLAKAAGRNRVAAFPALQISAGFAQDPPWRHYCAPMPSSAN